MLRPHIEGRGLRHTSVMPGIRVDYDRIAPTYDQRFADGGLRGVAAALRALVEGRGVGWVLEVGCGTGHWLAGLRPVAGRLVGLDLSAGMLVQGRQRGERLSLVRGRAGQLPWPDGSIELVYCVNAIHHFQEQRAFVSEARRLLRPGGALAVIGMDPRVQRSRWYIYDYFDGIYETDLARFPSWGTVLDWMTEAGFEPIEWCPLERIRAEKVGRAVLDDPYLRKDACSQLALLGDEAYASGLRRIEAALEAAEAAGETLTFSTDLLQDMLVGRVPLECGG